MCNIVIADDEYLEREVIKHIAHRIEGAHIVGEGNCGRLAVELCTALKPDLAFINCNMGGMDGFEAVKRIRKVDRDIKIVMTTAHDRYFAKRDLETLGIDEYLLKPIRPVQLDNIIRKHLHTHGARPAVTPRKKRRLSFYPNQIMSKEITRALIYLDNHYQENISLDSVAEMISLSSYYFSRLFKKEVGVNFSDLLLHKRIDKAKQMLEETEKSILDICIAVGYQEQSYFCKVFKKSVGATPSAYRKTTTSARSERRKISAKYL